MLFTLMGLNAPLQPGVAQQHNYLIYLLDELVQLVQVHEANI